jgi:secondary thiamine-phosphate synthase enzyme
LINKIGVVTKSRVEFQNITGHVRDVVKSSGVADGICHVFVPHTTAAVTINEQADPSVVEDIIAQLDVMVPQHGRYRHMEGNSPAHIKASLLGSSETVIVENGDLVLGTWQGIFFCEFDGPRSRKVVIKVVPESGE